jgi:hypothetical protein
LAFVGSDIAQKSLDAEAIRAYGVPDAWFDELRRYARLSDLYGGPPLRRASFALMALAAIAFLFRSRRDKRTRIDLPATALIMMFFLLIAAPSKWPWHFGALMGVGSLAIATETFRLSRDGNRSLSWSARPFIAVGGSVVAIAWIWGPRAQWSVLDLSTLEWRLGFERVMSLSTVAAGLPLILGGILMLTRSARGARSDVPWRVACLTAPAIAVPAVVFTIAVLSVDGAKSNWTIARQNIEMLGGNAGCGLGDNIVVPASGSMTPLHIAGGGKSAAVPDWVPVPPVPGAPRFALGPIGAGATHSPWFHTPHTESRLGFFTVGAPTVGSRLQIEWGRMDSNAIQPIGSAAVEILPDTSLLPRWRFVAATDVPRTPTGANVARISLQNDAAPGPAAAVTSLMSYSDQKLAPLLTRPGEKVWVNPSLVTYFPCADLTRFRDGVAEVPRYVVARFNTVPLGYSDSPFGGVTDVYDLERLTFADSENADSLAAMRVYRVHAQLPGAALARPDKTSFVA